MELPFDLAIPLLRLYPKNPETPIQKNICSHLFKAVLFTIAKICKQLQFSSVDKCIFLKNCGTSTQWNTMQQKERTTPFCNNMDGTGDY